MGNQQINGLVMDHHIFPSYFHHFWETLWENPTDPRTVHLQVNQLQSSLHAFAALRSDGSVITWGRIGDGGNSQALQSQRLGADSRADDMWRTYTPVG